MLTALGIWLAVQVTILIVWTVRDNKGVEEATITLQGTGIEFQQVQCDEGNIETTTVLLVLFSVLVLFALWEAIKARNVPAKFNEGRLAAVAVVCVGFAAITIVPAHLISSDPTSRYIGEACCILFGMIVSTT
ncbi:hypothetical protein HDV00_012111 [Rhizophlyctis rosea]|nr:hypothetical protein HDV00_012111 [Rhizophlyctis rosea]